MAFSAEKVEEKMASFQAFEADAFHDVTTKDDP